ncbi:MAG TPA: pirin family protein [Rhizomicrobium sp.]|nr:pirin family protein [Rhizomicrobium sp.]
MLETVIDQRRKDLGGFEVGRVLPNAARRMVGPFIFFDHMGPVDFPRGIPRTVDVRPHPHIGLSTITYLFSGEIMHRDSLGTEQAIRPGEVNWMIAGRGITHSERFEKARAEGGRLHGIQAWVALPTESEDTEPSFVHHGQTDLPVVGEAATNIRVIAGEAFGARARVTIHSPMFYAHVELGNGQRLELPDGFAERAVYLVSGDVEADGNIFGPGHLLVFRKGDEAVVRAKADATLLALGGDPVGPRFIEWNFVASSQARIDQAKADWRAGRFKLPDLDNKEFIPLPDPPPAANPMS